jgi:cytochrome c-type biogenesis protein CcmH/NrfG
VYCTNCGDELKDGASFCKSCGQPVGADGKDAGIAAEVAAVNKKSWLHSFGVFLFVPIFAGIIVLLFWVNRDPEPIHDHAEAGQNAMPDMAAMEQVHSMLQRLKDNVESNPDDIVSVDSLADLYSIAGRFDKAQELYKKYLEVDAENNDVRIKLADTYYRTQQNDQALEILQTILKQEPDYAPGLHYLAEIQLSQGKKAEALQNLQKIVDTYPGTEFAKAAQQRIHIVEHSETN